jgi:hypothetical protein
LHQKCKHQNSEKTNNILVLLQTSLTPKSVSGIPKELSDPSKLLIMAQAVDIFLVVQIVAVERFAQRRDWWTLARTRESSTCLETIQG